MKRKKEKCGGKSKILTMIGPRIHSAAVRHEVETGHRATNLYLGRAELEDLKAFFEMPESYLVMGVGGAKSTFCGLTIYGVFDESLLAVGN